MTKDIAKEIVKRINKIDDPLLNPQFHMPNFEVPINKYTKARLLSLYRDYKDRTFIYLDQNFWINFRKIKYGQSFDVKYSRLYSLLSSLCASGKIVCPIGFSHYLEILRQADPKTRVQTAEIMDELCCGLAIIPYNALSDLEVVNHIMGSVLGREYLHENKELAWIYPGFIAGLVHPSETAFDPKTELAIQKSFFEHTRYRTLKDTIELTDNVESIRVLESDEEFQRRQTEECSKHRSEYNNFQECYLNEIMGCVDLHRDAIVHATSRIWTIRKGVSPTSSQVVEINKISPQLENLIRLAFKSGKIKTELPCLDVMASCHAIKRYKQIPFKKGDQHDFMHARTALPYCDYFLTERVLGEMLCDKLIKLDLKYNCNIMWDVGLIIDHFDKSFDRML